MKISLRRTDPFSGGIKRLGKLYSTAFPDDERAPYHMLVLKSAKKNVDFWSLYADGEWFGLAYVVNSGSLSYIFYFAVDESKRGKGLGSAALQALRRKYAGRRLLLALEPLDNEAENADDRRKRRQFYINNGFLPMIGYKIREANVIYDVMSVGGSVAPEEYAKLMRDYLGYPIFRAVSTEMFKG